MPRGTAPHPDRPIGIHRQTVQGARANRLHPGESHHPREIRALFPTPDLADGTEVVVPVGLVHTPNNPHDHNAVEVRAATGLVGFLSREDAVRYAPDLSALQQGGWTASTSARVWGYDQENWDTGKKEFVGSIRIDLPEPHMLIPANRPPKGAHQILPVGAAIQVTGEENHMPAIQPYLNSDGECWIHATLHEIVEEGPRSSRTLAEVRIDEQTVGRLTPKMSSDLLPAVSYLAELGKITCVRAIVKGNRLKAEIVLYTLRAHELPADWFSGLTVVQGASNASEGALAPAESMHRDQLEQPQVPSRADAPRFLLRGHLPTGMPILNTLPDSGTGMASSRPSTPRLDCHLIKAGASRCPRQTWLVVTECQRISWTPRVGCRSPSAEKYSSLVQQRH